MQTRRSIIQSKTTRRGFTLIELLVVISIIATLMALILPAIQSAREAARRTQCQNYLKNITLGAIGFAEAHKGVLPASGTYRAANTTHTDIYPAHSWVLDVLPYLDQTAVTERWNPGLAFNAGSNATYGAYNLEVLTCPNDDTAVGQNGGLTYVANCGFGDADIDTIAAPATSADYGHTFAAEPMTWDGAGAALSDQNIALTKELGVFWANIECLTIPAGASVPPETLTDRASANIGRIYDGAGNTIMFTENVMGGADSTGQATWANPSIRSCGFMVPITPAANMTFAGLPTYVNGALLPFINQQRNGVDGTAPFPNSRHIGIIVASFCDGTVRPIDQNIDQGVYIRLVTPGGARPRISGAFPEAPIRGNDF